MGARWAGSIQDARDCAGGRVKGYVLRPLMGVALVAALVAVVVLAATLFRGGFSDSVPVTVFSTAPVW